MRNEISLLIRGLGDKVDPHVSEFLLNGLETGAFDYSSYKEVYNVQIVVNQGNEDALRQLVEKFKLILKPDAFRIVERCLTLDNDNLQAVEDEADAGGGIIKRTTRFLNRPSKKTPVSLGPLANKRVLDYGSTIDRITDGIASNCRGYNRLEAFILGWVATDTFLHTAENKTRLDNFKSTGRVDRKCWITQRDEKVRHTHQIAERQEVNLYEGK